MKKFFSILLIFGLLWVSPGYGLEINVHPIKNNFTSGEITPKAHGRTDLARYQGGVKELTNFLIMHHGGVTRRGGFEYVDTVKNSSYKVRLALFEYSTVQQYVLEFGVKDASNGYFRVYRFGASGLYRITDIHPSLSQDYIDTPYKNEDELVELQFAQSADTLYVAHRNYAIRKITRTAEDSWTISNMTGGPLINNGPFWDENYYPNPDDVVSDASRTRYAFSLTKLKVGESGTIKSWRATNKGASVWENGQFFDNAGQPFIKPITPSYADRVQWVGALIRLTRVAASDRTNNDNWVVVRITSVTDATNAAMIVVKSATEAAFTTSTPVGDLAKTVFQLGCWNGYEVTVGGGFGYPRSIVFHEGRLYAAGTRSRPQSLWGSKSSDIENFTPGTKDNESFSFTISSGKINTIQWMISGRILTLGGVGGEIRASGSGDAAITPTNINVKSDTNSGSAYLAPQKVGQVILFLDYSQKILRELTYSWEVDSYVAPDMTILADHLTQDYVINSYDFQRTPPYPVIWAVRSDGKLLAMTYERTQDIVGWSRHTTGAGGGDSFESVVCPYDAYRKIYAPAVVVKRGSTRYIEATNWNLQMDSGVVGTLAATNTYVSANLAHLIGSTVQVVTVDGSGVATQKVSKIVISSGGGTTGTIAIDPVATIGHTVYAGLSYDSKLVTLRPEIPLQGTSQGLKKKWNDVFIKVYNSRSMKVNGEPYILGASNWTGDKRIIMLGWSEDALITVEQTEPLPLSILSIYGTLSIGQ